MLDISNLSLVGTNPAVALAVPVLAQDPKSPTTKPTGKAGGKKNKPKGKPKKVKKLKDLSDFEKAAINRLKRFDEEIATALKRFLPLKDTAEKRIECIDDEIKVIKDRRKVALTGLKSPFADREGIEDLLDRLAEAEIDLRSIKKFYETGKFPNWYKDLLKQIEKAKKQKDKKSPTSKPTEQTPNGLIQVSDALLVGLALPNGDARA